MRDFAFRIACSHRSLNSSGKKPFCSRIRLISRCPAETASNRTRTQAGWEVYAGYFISVLVCIDPATHENGCLQLAHRPETELVGPEWEPLTESETAKMTFLPVETEPGDIIYFDSYTPHMSNPNMTARPRRLYFATYNRLSEGDHRAAYYADKRRNFPPDIERVAGKEYVYRV